MVTKYNYVTITKLGGTMETPKKPGRPAKLGTPMTDRQRAAMCRARRYEAASMAHENMGSATTAVLLAGLARQLKATADADRDRPDQNRVLTAPAMPTPVLAERLRAGETLWCAWSALPEPLVAEAVARAGFDCVTFDAQHGLHDVGSVMRGIGAGQNPCSGLVALIVTGQKGHRIQGHIQFGGIEASCKIVQFGAGRAGIVKFVGEQQRAEDQHQQVEMGLVPSRVP